jgi:hypothetical protein
MPVPFRITVAQITDLFFSGFRPHYRVINNFGEKAGFQLWREVWYFIGIKKAPPFVGAVFFYACVSGANALCLFGGRCPTHASPELNKFNSRRYAFPVLPSLTVEFCCYAAIFKLSSPL